MYLENVVIDSVDPQRLGRFWQAALGTETLSDAPGIYETRLSMTGDHYLDLCFPAVPEPPPEQPRLHLDLRGGASRAEEVERLLALGAQRMRVGHLGQHADPEDVSRVVLGDPEGHPFCVTGDEASYADAGPLVALVLESADPDRDARFWSRVTGWVEVAGAGGRALRHPSLRGPLLELRPERSAKTVKNRLHLDVRLEAGDDPGAVEADLVEHGGQRLTTDWGDLPWRSYLDPSGNELCLLPAPA